MILGSKGQRLGLGLQKHIEGDRVTGLSHALYPVPSLYSYLPLQSTQFQYFVSISFFSLFF